MCSLSPSDLTSLSLSRHSPTTAPPLPGNLTAEPNYAHTHTHARTHAHTHTMNERSLTVHLLSAETSYKNTDTFIHFDSPMNLICMFLEWKRRPETALYFRGVLCNASFHPIQHCMIFFIQSIQCRLSNSVGHCRKIKKREQDISGQWRE